MRFDVIETTAYNCFFNKLIIPWRKFRSRIYSTFRTTTLLHTGELLKLDIRYRSHSFLLVTQTFFYFDDRTTKNIANGRVNRTLPGIYDGDNTEVQLSIVGLRDPWQSRQSLFIPRIFAIYRDVLFPYAFVTRANAPISKLTYFWPRTMTSDTMTRRDHRRHCLHGR